MRVLLVNTSERIGGAAVAASRLLGALISNGVKAKMLVRDKQTANICVIPLSGKRLFWKFIWERIAIWRANHFQKNHLFTVDIANVGTDITQLPEFKEADIIHLHWINQGLLSLHQLDKIFASGKPVVWTMHDLWACTGICHYPRACVNYQSGCGHCQYLYKGGSKHDLSYRVFRKKQKLYDGRRVRFVGCSRWLAGLAEQSTLLKGQPVTSIPNAINTHLFKPKDKQQVRRELDLPEAGKFILFGALKVTDKRKGLDYLLEACNLLATEHPELKETVGVIALGNQSQQVLASLLPFKLYPMGFVMDEHQLVDIYNAATLFAIPSLEDNLPNTIMEAMACGVPCVGFHTGGIPEMIDHGQNGYVAQYRSAEDFAKGMYHLLTTPDYATISDEATRKVVTTYSEDVVAKQYITLYHKMSARNI
jgi:glycosyltransferase involved in cell wall biosynthesis